MQGYFRRSMHPKLTAFLLVQRPPKNSSIYFVRYKCMGMHNKTGSLDQSALMHVALAFLFFWKNRNPSRIECRHAPDLFAHAAIEQSFKRENRTFFSLSFSARSLLICQLLLTEIEWIMASILDYGYETSQLLCKLCQIFGKQLYFFSSRRSTAIV